MTMPQTGHYEMKDSGVEWIGEMPRHWRIERAKFHFRQSFERGNSTPELLAATQKHGMYPQRLLEGVVQVMAGTDLQQFKSVHINDFVISLRSFQGGFERSDYEGVCSPAYQVFHADKQYDVKWLKWFFKNDMFIDAMNALTVGIREGRNIKFDDFANSLLPVPPLSEQTAIAAYLDEKCATIDAIIAEAKASIEEYKSWKASVIFETVTKGLNPNAEMKDSGVEWIGEIPGGWAVERLKAMFSFGKGLPITKEDLVEQGIPVISYGQIHAKFNTGVEVLPQLLRYVDAKWLESNANSLVSEGDFIFADTSEDMEGCGNCVYVDTLNEGAQLFAGYHTITFKPKRSKHNKFLAYLFKSDAWRTQLRSRVGGVKLFSISRRMLNLATVILPPQNEQTAIVAYLDSKCAAIDGIILEKEDLIRELENYKRSLIFEAVTGKRRVC